jgi:hypothetical protein
MKRRIASILVLLAAPAFAAAQSPNGTTASVLTFDGKASKTATTIGATAPVCPVSMQAKQGSGGGLVMVKRVEPSADSQSNKETQSFRPTGNIHLIVSKKAAELDFQQIASGTVTAFGLSARGRVERAPAATGNGLAEIRRTQQVRFTADDDGSFYADLDLPGFASVRSIRIESLTFKDGSQWSFDSARACTVAPDPLMLIAVQ